MTAPRPRSLYVGLGLLGLLFVGAVAHLVGRAWAERGQARRGEVVLRLAHWHLQSGIPEALGERIAEYERLRPGVRIEQMVIPERSWPAWQRTQLVGGNPPDLLELAVARGMTDDLRARYLLPLTPWVEQPNPHNAGTPLAGLPWRTTFIDGLAGSDSFSAGLAEYFGVPTALFTVRIYYNRNLLREILGEDRPPRSFDAFVELVERARTWAEREDRPLVPIAGSRFNAPHLLDRLALAQLQRLGQRLDWARQLDPHPDRQFNNAAFGFLRGEWDFDTPDVRSAFALARIAGGAMQPGFLQLGREDATFLFTQGNALMIVTGNFDITSLGREAPFPLGVFDIPLPGADHPRFGAGVIGPASEASKQPAGVFGITRASRHPEQALDFLRYLTSRPANERFSRDTLWLPALAGLDPPPGAEAFAARLEGAVDGPSLFLGESARLLHDRNLHRLVAPHGGVERFIEAIAPAYEAAVREDLARATARVERAIARADTLLEAYRGLGEEFWDRRALLLETQHQQEELALRNRHGLAPGRGPAPGPRPQR